jgi:hypothetical protein
VNSDAMLAHHNILPKYLWLYGWPRSISSVSHSLGRERKPEKLLGARIYKVFHRGTQQKFPLYYK